MNDRKWGGYSLEEIRIKQATTDLRIEIEKERIKYALNQGMGGQPTLSGLGAFIDSANNIFRMTLYGIRSYRMVKNFVEVCRNLKNKR